MQKRTGAPWQITGFARGSTVKSGDEVPAELDGTVRSLSHEMRNGRAGIAGYIVTGMPDPA